MAKPTLFGFVFFRPRPPLRPALPRSSLRCKLTALRAPGAEAPGCGQGL